MAPLTYPDQSSDQCAYLWRRKPSLSKKGNPQAIEGKKVTWDNTLTLTFTRQKDPRRDYMLGKAFAAHIRRVNMNSTQSTSVNRWQNNPIETIGQRIWGSWGYCCFLLQHCLSFCQKPLHFPSGNCPSPILRPVIWARLTAPACSCRWGSYWIGVTCQTWANQWDWEWLAQFWYFHEILLSSL